MDKTDQKKYKDAIDYLSSRSKPANIPEHLKEMLNAQGKNWAFTINDKFSIVGNIVFNEPFESTLFPGFQYKSNEFSLQDENKKITRANISIVYHSDLRRWDGQLNFLDDSGNCNRIVSIVSAIRREF